MDYKDLIEVARGDRKADLILANANIINVFTAEIERNNVAIYDKYIAGIGDYTNASKVVDLKGQFLSPGFINGHTHIESSFLGIGEYARAVLPHGTTSIVTDLHEIANVSGVNGLKYILESANNLPLNLLLMLPSCVPATHLETSGAVIGPDDIREMLNWDNVIGLGEMMNFPGVINAFDNVLLKLAVAQDRVIDGHAPGVGGKSLQAYISAGITSDHESTTLAEAEEKLRYGMYVMVREGSSEKNLEPLLPIIQDNYYHRCFFVVDDRTCYDLQHDGDIDAIIRKAIRLGVPPVRAIQMATINTATYFKLNRTGAIAPGYLADIVILSDLNTLDIESVYYHGQKAAENGKALFTPQVKSSISLRNTVNIKSFDINGLKLTAKNSIFPVIEIIPGQIVTRKITQPVKIEDGQIMADTQRDLLKVCVLERHHATGNIGRGLVRGFGLKKGAIGSSVAHDSHNIVVVGTNDHDIYMAVKTIEKMQGGLVAVAEGKLLSALPLPVAGILSDEPLESVTSKLAELHKKVQEMGCQLPSPFATLSFLALPVIPELKITDLGVVDVNSFRIIG